MNTISAEQQREDVLLSLGFEKQPGDNIFSHKMFEDSFFRFENSDPDIFWSMDVIFKTCIKAGEKRKAEAIKDLLFI